MRIVRRLLRVLGLTAAGAAVALASPLEHEFLGADVVALGDVNGDGTPDFGACDFRGERSSVWVFSGRDAAELWTAPGLDLVLVPGAGKDGGPAVAIGLAGSKGTNWIQLRNAGDGEVLRDLPTGRGRSVGADETDSLEVDYLGDADGDGTPDLLVVRARRRTPRDREVPDQTPWCDGVTVGIVSVAGALIAEFEPKINELHRQFIAGAAGDVDGDGKADLLLGTETKRTELEIHVVNFKNEPLLTFGRKNLSAAPDAMLAVGDVDGDSRADFVIGDHLASFGSKDFAGVLHVLSGKDGKRIRELRGKAQDEYLGYSVAALGDVDGDGHMDFAGGAPGANTKRESGLHGAVYAFSGKSGKQIWRTYGEHGLGRLGQSMAAIGDVNGDGISDLAVGAPASIRVGGHVVVLCGKTGERLATTMR